jgi:hypothetical protein
MTRRNTHNIAMNYMNHLTVFSSKTTVHKPCLKCHLLSHSLDPSSSLPPSPHQTCQAPSPLVPATVSSLNRCWSSSNTRTGRTDLPRSAPSKHHCLWKMPAPLARTHVRTRNSAPWRGFFHSLPHGEAAAGVRSRTSMALAAWRYEADSRNQTTSPRAPPTPFLQAWLRLVNHTWDELHLRPLTPRYIGCCY